MICTKTIATVMSMVFYEIDSVRKAGISIQVLITLVNYKPQERIPNSFALYNGKNLVAFLAETIPTHDEE
ncbi:hypothetical protein SAMN05421877_102286 [Sphingobacterium lactis]|uniref:Uncharacterized protein n=1 Tax=Sphingobacterium lactis TaxID=797291 RepID=A0A1H5UG82_9SPHI|nr:hypothetical protein SAMN05421877_102286 [Sphingobacterium lactis]